ncbi:hypothetical protein, partial [Streptomyces sp. NPDC058424]|uniref:hypothetical protein n=1 Tax=Streptomyces sp. NPDC058424 TaxID=3346491 RepID=UPI00366113EC
QEHRWPQAWISDGHQPRHPTAAHLGISMAVDMPKGDGTITPVFVVEPAGWQVYKQTWGNGPECPVTLLLQRNNHDVVEYSLLGGP